MSVKRIILLVGLPGSGKTTLGNQLVKKFPNTTLFIDDIGQLTKDPITYLQEIKEKQIYDTIIISDVYFCRKAVLEMAIRKIKAIFKDANIETIFFENNIEKCKKNIKQRMLQGDDRKVNNLLNILHKDYVPCEKPNSKIRRIKTN